MFFIIIVFELTHRTNARWQRHPGTRADLGLSARQPRQPLFPPHFRASARAHPDIGGTMQRGAGVRDT